jgi:2-polyprenyl-3-methyl-5-hydroxy-6-metoxy-1,4-benzoquinol methylase
MTIKDNTKNYFEFGAFLEKSNASVITRENLERLLTEKLKNHSKISNFSMLDVGSSDGEMSLPLAVWLKEQFDNFKYVAVEPEKPAFEKLNKRMKAQKIDFAETNNLTVEKYFETKKNEEAIFDFILFAQSFYHIPKNEWEEIISDSRRLLKPAGYLMIILDSSEGQSYELADLITENKTRFDTLEFGELYFAEDIEEFLDKNGIKYSEDKFTRYTVIKENEKQLYNFARYLAFLYRTFPEKILENYEAEVGKFLERHKKDGKYMLEDIVKIVILEKV